MKSSSKSKHCNLRWKFVRHWKCKFSSATLFFRRQPAEFFSPKKFVKWMQVRSTRPIQLRWYNPLSHIPHTLFPSKYRQDKVLCWWDDNDGLEVRNNSVGGLLWLFWPEPTYAQLDFLPQWSAKVKQFVCLLTQK